jgi:hypothetical protein
MDSVAIASTLIGLKQQNTQAQIQTAVMKNAQESQQAVIDMINASATNLANIQASAPAGMGRFVDRSA